MVMAGWYGQMAQSTKDIGSLEMLRARESSFMLMVTFTKVNGTVTRPTAMALIIMSMAQSTKACGSKTCSTVKAWRHGLTVQNMKETMKMGRNMEWANMSGMMGRSTSENGSITKSPDLVLIHGLMGAPTKVSGTLITKTV